MDLKVYGRASIPISTIAVAYAFVAFISLRLFATLNASASPIWPPTGLAVASLLLLGRRVWPGITVGAFIANLLRQGTAATSVAIAIGNTLEAVVAVSLIIRFGEQAQPFDKARNLGVFVLAAGLAGPLISATTGVTSLAAEGFVQLPSYGLVWITWFLGDASGALVLTPLLLAIFRPSSQATILTVGVAREFILLALAVIGTGVLLFVSPVPSSIPPVPLSFTMVPLIAWASLRFGSKGATYTTAVFSTIAVLATLSGFGPFASTDTNTALLSLQFSIMIVATTGLAVGSMVRERRDAETQARIERGEKLAVLGTMVSGVGHEVRTPLSYININLALIEIETEKLRKGETTIDDAAAKIETLIAKSKEGVGRADKIVQQLRQFATAQPKPALADLSEAVTSSVELFRSLHKGEVEVVTDLVHLTGFAIDKGQVQQVLINLLNNGADAMHQRGTLKVRLREVPMGAEIDVEDSGEGIPEQTRNKVFESFFTTKTEGTGLGLSVSKRIIEDHGGTIRFTTSNKGTTFTVTIPKKA